MAIQKSWENGERVYIPTCDMCGDELEAEYDFYDAVDAKKAAGWRSKQLHGEWGDYCPDCWERMNRQAGAADDFAGIR